MIIIQTGNQISGRISILTLHLAIENDKENYNYYYNYLLITNCAQYNEF